jgi:DNA end-binding protein Ku
VPEQENRELRRMSIWSGTLTFGMVSIPVVLLPGQTSQRVRLRMLSPDGTPLARRYYCPAEDRPVEHEKIIRGYEIEKGKFVTITEDELESLQPEKSREIDLRRFVPVEQIDPELLDRAYFLAPVGDSTKPYRLLTETMEKAGKAGIATFVMRDKEYLVAILAENGLLMAETLRFADEIRSSEVPGIPDDRTIDPDRLKAMVREIRNASADEIELNELKDLYTERLNELAEQKRAAGQDLISSPEGEKESGNTGNVIDLMQVLKRSMEKEDSKEPAQSEKKAADSLDDLNKTELYNKAKQLQISGRSAMTRQELINAIRNA